jgi:hypothetical protein
MFLGVGWLGVECQVKAGVAAAARRLQATYQPRFGDKLSPIGQARRRWSDAVAGFVASGQNFPDKGAETICLTYLQLAPANLTRSKVS